VTGEAGRCEKGTIKQGHFAHSSSEIVKLFA